MCVCVVCVCVFVCVCACVRACMRVCVCEAERGGCRQGLLYLGIVCQSLIKHTMFIRKTGADTVVVTVSGVEKLDCKT